MAESIDFKEMLENLPLTVMRLFYEDNIWKTKYITPGIARYGFSPEQFLSGAITWADMIHPDDRVLVLKRAHDYMVRDIEFFKLEYRILTPSGESVAVTEDSTIHRNPDGSLRYVDSLLLNTTTAKLGDAHARENYRPMLALNDVLLTLYETPNPEQAISIILTKAGEFLNCSRALLFQDSPDHTACRVAYEWCNHGITSVKDLGYVIVYEIGMPEIYTALRGTGELLVNAGEIPENCQEEFEHEGLVASAIFAVYQNGDHYGFVCFDDCVIERRWDEETTNFLKVMANLISNTLQRMA